MKNMKRMLTSLLLAMAVLPAMQAQVSIKDPNITFFGLDFSKSKMLGTDGFSNPGDIVGRIFGEWNSLIVNEKDKYNVKYAFQKAEVNYDFSIVDKRNATVNANELVTNNSYSIDEKTVAGVIKNYSSKTKGLGVVLVVEKFDKTEEKASVFVTYFDIGAKKVLLTERVTAAPVGFGFRNYWAGAIAKILKECHNKTAGWEAASK